MSLAAERATAAEPDRLAQFSSPREVDGIVGHAEALAEFARARDSGRMHHAWLLVGPEGVGKATLAYHFARTALAENAGEETVDASHPVFRKVAVLAHPNLLLLRRSWIEKTKRYSQWIGVDEVRRLRAFLGNTAGEDAWRVVIVDRADELSQSAANALLKALEEPPPGTLFLLVSSAEGRLPATIRSRTRTLRVTGLSQPDLKTAVEAALERGGQEADTETLQLALALGQGSVRRALELVSGEGIELYREIAAMLGALPELDGVRLHKLADPLSSQAETQRLELYFALMLGLIERLTRFAATGEGLVGEEQTLAMRLVSTDNLVHWAEVWEALAKAKAEAFELNLDRSLLLLDAWFKLQQLVRQHPV
ncbi:MAG: DNA polymerase III subunit delta' [Methyloceanibacter sp.]